MTRVVWYWKCFKVLVKELRRYWKERVPRPGTIEAWTRGCSCPKLENDFGTTNKAILNSKCKLHKNAE